MPFALRLQDSLWHRESQVAGEFAAGENSGCEEQAFSTRLDTYAAEFDRYAGVVNCEELADALKAVARDCRNLMEAVRGGRID